ncbi:GumC family protein [Planctomyces sp. SH-PL62]|uniref:GumC family protein n=1 Tax=Planctomyces sp. SH-PL62 TaxID=1636152 RepID=UPI00078EDF4F|nr:polysaccharide biosynthesis tyrosine autokinase [Planctomyces sp. SH-PL62]AMV35809.1 Tyrosine-protein kinase YwqD [Planctomyces sp. SH-PL62]
MKTPGHYLGALRRRFWLALIVAVPMGTLTSIWALRQPKIYQAVAQIRIEQPHYDAALSTLVSRDIGPVDSATQTSYATDLVTDLQGRGLADKVLSNTRLGPELAQLDDPAMELIVSNITVKQLMKSNTYNVALTGRDPALTKRLLEAELEELVKHADGDRRNQVDQTVQHTESALNKLRQESAALEKQMLGQIASLGTIGPGGRNILEEQYAHLGQSIAHKQARVVEFQQKTMFAPLFPREGQGDPVAAMKQQQMAQLQDAKDQLTKRLLDLKRKARHFNSDPAVQNVSNHLNDVLDEIDQLGASFQKTKMAADPTEMIIESQHRDIEADESRLADLLERMRKAMPDHQKFLGLMSDRDTLRKRIADMEHDLASFEILAKSQTAPVKILTRIEEPTVPIKPNRVVSIAMGLIVSIGLGLGLVFLLEHLDHSVREPEHVSHGLSLPLLGIVPRIPRTALTHRGGGHLWTPAVPDSAAADAFRNIRASLLGAADRNGPIVSLLVTSAKAGDGKSTAALNLAAACARAGERTLLMDVDLRRPTLADAFPADPDDEDSGLGLVDVLKGSVPWQATLRHTDLHNLDFIATGDPSGVPIEILGTLELRQLLAALTHHYDRVILDGPAILGMADCRVLGRMVDAAVLVVRAGVHPTMTLQRAKAVLEQSHVEIAGVIVNGLSEGVENWSSYGYGPAPIAASSYRRDRALPASPTAAPAREDALAGAPADA